MNCISRNKAVTIAADWHNGQMSALYSFASTGFVLQNDLPKYLAEITVNLDNASLKKQQVRRLTQLKRYLQIAAATLTK